MREDSALCVCVMLGVSGGVDKGVRVVLLLGQEEGSSEGLADWVAQWEGDPGAVTLGLPEGGRVAVGRAVLEALWLALGEGVEEVVGEGVALPSGEREKVAEGPGERDGCALGVSVAFGEEEGVKDGDGVPVAPSDRGAVGVRVAVAAVEALGHGELEGDGVDRAKVRVGKGVGVGGWLGVWVALEQAKVLREGRGELEMVVEVVEEEEGVRLRVAALLSVACREGVCTALALGRGGDGEAEMEGEALTLLQALAEPVEEVMGVPEALGRALRLGLHVAPTPRDALGAPLRDPLLEGLGRAVVEASREGV